MPTYSYHCPRCERDEDLFRSLGDYLHNPRPLFCCGLQMERVITVAPGLAIHNALAGDRLYDGLRAQDGTDISTRTKHRAYMRQHNLTTIDDYRGEWQREAKARQDRLDGIDPQRREDIARAVAKLEK